MYNADPLLNTQRKKIQNVFQDRDNNRTDSSYLFNVVLRRRRCLHRGWLCSLSLSPNSWAKLVLIKENERGFGCAQWTSLCVTIVYWSLSLSFSVIRFARLRSKRSRGVTNVARASKQKAKAFDKFLAVAHLFCVCISCSSHRLRLHFSRIQHNIRLINAAIFSLFGSILCCWPTQGWRMKEKKKLVVVICIHPRGKSILTVYT